MHESLQIYFEYAQKGLIRGEVSPCGRLVIFNYTDKCVYDRAWDAITLACRGIIFELETGKIVARPFKKFFNMGEPDGMSYEEILHLEENEECLIQEKLDGSLGIIFFYDGKWQVATRGSFVSHQAQKATEMLKKYNTENLFTAFTLLVEIIYPANKVVVNYNGAEKLVLLSIVHNNSNEDIASRYTLEHIAYNLNMELAPFHAMKIEEAVKKLPELSKDEEGFVVWFPHSNKRCKLKGHEYMRIHKIISNMTPLSLWEVMENGKVPQKYIEQIPEEWRDEFDSIRITLELQYKKIYDTAHQELQFLPSQTDFREIGLFLKDNPGKISYPHLVFPIIKDRGVEKCIMNLMRPTGNEIVDIEKI